MTFDTPEDLRREKKAIELFVSMFSGSYQKLDPQDVDYKVFDKDNKLIAYAEVVSRVRTMVNAYPLPVPAKKLVKLFDKRIPPVIIWSCDDGIIYAKANELRGEIIFDSELIVYYKKSKEFKYIRFT
jgi:Na+-transporting NADH:ubiquinone oxidoreductase subunit NqrC